MTEIMGSPDKHHPLFEIPGPWPVSQTENADHITKATFFSNFKANA